MTEIIYNWCLGREQILNYNSKTKIQVEQTKLVQNRNITISSPSTSFKSSGVLLQCVSCTGPVGNQVNQSPCWWQAIFLSIYSGNSYALQKSEALIQLGWSLLCFELLCQRFSSKFHNFKSFIRNLYCLF